MPKKDSDVTASTVSDYSKDNPSSEEFIEKTSGKRIKRIIAIVTAIALIAGAGAFIVMKKGGKNDMKMPEVKITVERRSIENTISSSSVIEPKDSYSVTAMVTGEIVSDTFNEGDIVKKDDVLYTIDSESAQKKVKTAQNSLTKAERAYNEALEEQDNLNIKAAVRGTVSEVFVKEGDNISSGAKIASIYDDTQMKLSIPFNENDASHVRAGQSAELTIVGTGDVIYGTVSDVSTAIVALEDHAQVRYVTIYANNPGSLTTSDKATAIVNGVACHSSANFENVEETTILSKASGTLKRLNIQKNDKVYANQTVAVLDSDSIETSLQNAKISLDDAQINLEDTKETLEDYIITAPIDGTIVIKNKKAGDNMDNSNSSDTREMCIIYDLSSLKFQLSVDETEVKEIKVGQEVKVTADAMEGEWKGVVEKVGIDGTSSNGVTTYPVDVTISEYGELLPGMNITAEIVVSRVENVLAVPIGSVNRGNIVYVKGEKTDEKDKAPDGYKSVEVKTGISDADYIEIISGLEEGQEVKGQEISTDETEQMMPGGMPGMGGGMPGGGMPGGGGGMPAGGGGQNRGGGGGMPGGGMR